MRTTTFIIVIAALLCACGGKKNTDGLSAPNAKAENVEKSKDGVSSDNTLDLTDTNFTEFSRNLTVIPQDIPGNNSANVIPTQCGDGCRR